MAPGYCGRMEDKMELKMGLRNAAAVVFSLIIAFLLGMRCACGVVSTDGRPEPGK